MDLLGYLAQPVSSIGAGTVSFAGTVAGRGVVVVTHGALRSTYEPVTASLRVDTPVAAGQVIGLLQSVRSHCLPSVCLHLGVKRGDTYLDPLGLLGPRPIWLKPWSGDAPASTATIPLEAAHLARTDDGPALRPEAADDGSPGAPLRLTLGVLGFTGASVLLVAHRRQARG